MPLTHGCEWILGFDLRSCADATDSEWPRQRRDVYLLRSDTRRPRSVDARCWTRDGNSVHEAASIFGLCVLGTGSHERPVPSAISVTVPLWPCLPTIERFYRWSRAKGGPRSELIVVTLLTLDDHPVARRYPSGDIQLRERVDALSGEIGRAHV